MGFFDFLRDSNKERELVGKTFSFLRNTGTDVAQSLPRAAVSLGMSLVDPLQKGDQSTVKVSDNPVARAIYGSKPIETFQKRYEGNREVVGGSRFRGGAAPIALLGTGLSLGGDLLPFGGAKKKASETLLKTLVKETTEQGVKSLAKKAGVEVADDVAKQIAITKDASIIKNLLKGGKSQIPKEVQVMIPPVVKAPKVPKDIVKATVPDVSVFGSAQKRRGLLTTTQADDLPLATQAGSSAVQPQTYTQLNIAKTLDEARAKVSTNFDEVRISVNDLLDSGKQLDASTASLARALVEKAGSQGQDDVVTEIMTKIAPLATTSGQANVIWRGFASAYDTDAMLKFAQKVVDKANENAGWLTKAQQKITGKGPFALDDAAKNLIREKMAVIKKLPDGNAKGTAMKEVFETINDIIPPGASELFDAYRYQNLLSSPRTQGRNTVTNLFNTMVTRPATIATKSSTDWFGATLFGKERETYLKDVPTYYRGLFNSIADATEATKGAWRGELPIGQPDLKNLRAYQANKMPKGLTVVGRAMEAQDRFFQTLISSGEYAVQKSKGVSNKVARVKAEEVAQYSLFRNVTDPTNKTGQGALLSKIDQFTDTVNKFGQKHRSFKWFVPFVKTPMNISKQFIEYSPAGFATLAGAKGERANEQLAKALLGSSISLVGAKAALDGQTTWAPPKGEKEREAFFASGKKPYSINIGGKWVPMISFGPFAYALAMPAAVKEANEQADMDASTIDKLASVMTSQAKFFSQQTYIQGISNFVELVSGAGEGDLQTNFAKLGTQVIPLSGLQRYVATALDPVFRKQSGPMDAIKSGIPQLSKQLEPYTDPFTGEPSRRNITDYVLPYSFGVPGSGPEQTKKEAYSEFYRAASRTSKSRTRANSEIDKAIIAGDTALARRIAAQYNEMLSKNFDKHREKYAQFRGEETFVKEYRKRRIRLTAATMRSRRKKLRTEGVI